MAMSSKAFSFPSAMLFDCLARSWTRVTCAVALATLAAACDNGSLNRDETTFHLRTLNLVEDSPSLAIDLDDTTVHALSYGGSSSFSASHPGSHNITFHAL